MKKFIVLLLSVMLVLGMMMGCSKDDGNNVSNGVKEANNEAADDSANSLAGRTIVVGRWGGNDAETAAFNRMVDDFTEKTGVRVEVRVYSNYNTELQVELIGGTAPDVFYVDAYMAPFLIEQGVLMALDPIAFEVDKFYQPLREAFMRDGNVYAISKDYSTLALYYNRRFVDASELPKTLEELWTGNFLTNLRDSLPSGVVPMTYNDDLARKMYIAQAGGLSIVRDEIFANLTEEGIINNLRPWIEAATAEKIFTPRDLGFGWNGDAFGNERTAIMIEGNWVLGFLEQNFPEVDFGVIEVPTFGGEKGTMVFTVGYGVNSRAREVEAAKAFVKYATGMEGMTTWTTGAGVLPSREDVTIATNVEADARKIPHIAGARYATVWQKGTTMDTINEQFKNFIPSAIKGERSLEDALRLAEEEANQIIRANQ